MWGLQLATAERPAPTELVEVRGRVAQSMVVCHSVKELLGVESAAEEEGEIAVCRLDDVSDLVDCLTAVERVLER